MSIAFATRSPVVPLFLLTLLLAVSPVPAEEFSSRHPIPGEDELKQAKRLLEKVYGKAYEEATTREAKSRLARRILDQAAKSEGEPVTRFALLDTAQRIAEQAGDVETALVAVGRLADAFELDVLARKAESLETASRFTVGEPALIELAEEAVALMDVGVELDEIETAIRLREVSIAAARRTRQTPFLKKIVNATAHLKEIEAGFAAYREALDRLGKDPTDADANLVAGRYLCLARGDWDRGVAMLALSADPALKAVATRELQGPNTPEAQTQVGDGWWEWADRQQGPDRESAMLRAGAWYRRAEPNVASALVRVKVQERLRLVEKIGRPIPKVAPPPAVAPFDTAEAKAHQQAWAEHLGVPVEITNSIGMKLVLIPPGEFDMGSTDDEVKRHTDCYRRVMHWIKGDGEVRRIASETPRHRVRITRPYYLGVCEVTQEQYSRIMGSNPSKYSGVGCEHYPVHSVSWYFAKDFCKRLSEKAEEQAAGRTYDLPSEAEWEHACRAGTDTEFPFGDDRGQVGDYAWYRGNSKNGGSEHQAHPVGGKKPNAWGLHDMLGNVEEWCNDWFGEDYFAKSPRVDPRGPTITPETETSHVARGGNYKKYLVWSSKRSCNEIEPGPKSGWMLTNAWPVYGFRVLCRVRAVRPLNSTEPPGPERTQEGSESVLFNGMNLDGWVTPAGLPVRAGWIVEDGAIVRKERGGNILSAREYGDFDLRFEWKVARGGNSGIKYRVARYGNQLLGCEYQLLDDENNRGNSRDPKRSAGALYGLYAPNDQKTLRPAGQYNQARIVVRGSRIEHWMNGKKILEADTSSEDWRRRVARSKFSDKPGFGQNRMGRIMLTDHGHPVWLRSVQLTELSPSAAATTSGDAKMPPFELTEAWKARIARAAPARPRARPAGDRKVLLFSLSTGFKHWVTPHTAEVVKILGKSGAYDVIESNSVEIFEPESIKRFDVIVLNNNCSHGKTRDLFFDATGDEGKAAALEKSLLAHIRSGHGLVAIHGAIVMQNNSAEFGRMLGGSFAFHPPQQKVICSLIDPSHALVAAFGGKPFVHVDEPYVFDKAYAQKNFRPLLTMDTANLDCGRRTQEVRSDVRYVAWIKRYGNGRVFYCGPSHNAQSFERPELLQFLLDGIQYAAGDLQCDDSPIGSPSAPRASRTY